MESEGIKVRQKVDAYEVVVERMDVKTSQVGRGTGELYKYQYVDTHGRFPTEEALLTAFSKVSGLKDSFRIVEIKLVSEAWLDALQIAELRRTQGESKDKILVQKDI